MATEYLLSYKASEIDKKLGDIDNKANISDIPTKISELSNDSGYITEAPVSSVNGKTGAVTLDALIINGVSYDGSKTMDITEQVIAIIDTKLNTITKAEEVSFPW